MSVRVLRAKRTKLRTAIETALAESRDLEISVDNFRQKLRAISAHLQSLLERIEILNEQIITHSDFNENEFDREIEDSDEALQLGLTACSEVAALLQRPPDGGLDVPAASPVADVSRKHGNPTDEASTANSATGATTVVHSHHVPLIDISPDPFDGRTPTYKLWRSQFQNWLKRRTDASGSDRLVALTKLLRGPPRSLVESLTLTDENFDVAMRLLDENYASDSYDSREIITSVSSVPRVRSKDDIPALRNLLISTRRTVEISVV